VEAIYLRVPEELKRAVEKRASELGLSVNELAAEFLAEAVGVEAKPAKGQKLDVELTIEVLTGVARASSPTTISYGDLAKRHGYDWSFGMRSLMRAHLISVWRECEQRGLPALTSLVVTRADHMPSSGFLALERSAGRIVGEEAAYVSSRQDECRLWARRLYAGTAALDPWPDLRGTWKGPEVEDFVEYMRGPADETAA